MGSRGISKGTHGGRLLVLALGFGGVAAAEPKAPPESPDGAIALQSEVQPPAEAPSAAPDAPPAEGGTGEGSPPPGEPAEESPDEAPKEPTTVEARARPASPPPPAAPPPPGASRSSAPPPPSPGATPPPPPASPSAPPESEPAPSKPAPSTPEDAADDPFSHDHGGTWLLLSATAGMAFNGRFTEGGEESDDKADTLFGLGAMLEWDGRYGLGLSYLRAGYGKERFPPNVDGSTLNVAYELDELWALGRYYLQTSRPAFYLGIGLGAALPRARATGASADAPLVGAAVPFECGDVGRVAPGALVAAGASFDLSSVLTLEAEVHGAGHLVDDGTAAHGRCGVGEGVAIPGAGPSMRAALRLGLVYRFEP